MGPFLLGVPQDVYLTTSPEVYRRHECNPRLQEYEWEGRKLSETLLNLNSVSYI